MDDLEKAILLASDSPAAAGASPAIREEALAFCARARDESLPSSLLRLCLSGLASSPHAHVHFWCLQSLHDALLRRRIDLPDDIALLRSSLLSLASSSNAASPRFLRNKLAQLISLLVRLDYPHVYSSYFLDLLPPSPPQSGPTDMFARVLISIDDDLLSQDYPRNADETADAGRVKDAMRAQCVPQIARHWHDAAGSLRATDPPTAAVALDAARRCISWIDVALVANDVFVPLLFDIALSPGTAAPLAAAAVGCLSAVAAKRMDARAKAALLRSLLSAQQGLGSPDSGSKMATLVTTYAVEALECYRKLGPADADGAAAMEMLEQVLPAVFSAAESAYDEDVDSASVLDFLAGYVSTMKAPSEKQLGHLGRILEVVRQQMLYDPVYRGHLDVLDKIGKEEEDLMAEQRKDLGPVCYSFRCAFGIQNRPRKQTSNFLAALARSGLRKYTSASRSAEAGRGQLPPLFLPRESFSPVSAAHPRRRERIRPPPRSFSAASPTFHAPVLDLPRRRLSVPPRRFSSTARHGGWSFAAAGRPVPCRRLALTRAAVPATSSLHRRLCLDPPPPGRVYPPPSPNLSPSPTKVVPKSFFIAKHQIAGHFCFSTTDSPPLILHCRFCKSEAVTNRALVALFRNICKVAPAATQQFIKGLLVTALSSAEATVEDIEVTLTLFYRLGEIVGEEEIRTGTGLLGELVPMLLSARFSCHTHRLVASVYLETVTRYIKFMQENVQYVPHLLAAFLDERGIHHQNSNVSRRAGYLFMKAVKLLKAKLVPYLDTILQTLEDVLGQFTAMDWANKEAKFSSSEDGSQIFEAVGLLIGIEEVSPEKQVQCLTALLNPLCHQIESLVVGAKAQGLEESSPRATSLQQIVVALNMLTKGFNERLVMVSRPTIGVMFKKTLDVVLQILVSFPNVKPLRSKVISFLHRMIEILGISVLPCIPVALRQLLVDNEAKDMVEFLVLINQIICKFNSSASGILEDVFPTIASRLSVILSQDAFSTGPAGNTEEMRELQELQRTLYTFLHGMVTHDLSLILLAPTCTQYLETIMQLLLYTSCSHKDILLRKACVQIFIRLIKDWCTTSKADDKLPGFRVFMIEKFATGCCLYSVLDKSFNLRDANTLVLFGEIVMAQKIMYERFGEDFVVNFVAKGLPEAHCPPDLAEQYYQKLQGNDTKALRSFYQSLIEKIRQQQNGSLVFR